MFIEINPAHNREGQTIQPPRQSHRPEPMPAGIPDIYREAAEEVRQLARRARLTDIRGDLLQLSARFERLAAYADAAIRLGAPGYPHGERLPAAGDRSDRARATNGPLSSGSRPHSESANLNLPASDSNRTDRERASGSAHAAGKS